MASMRDIKRRKSSVQSTQQITKAMKLVSTVKLQRARNTAERSKTYFEGMYDTVNSILARMGSVKHRYLQAGDNPKKAVITISSNRGLAGGYNSNIVKLITGHEEWKKEDTILIQNGVKVEKKEEFLVNKEALLLVKRTNNSGYHVLLYSP